MKQLNILVLFIIATSVLSQDPQSQWYTISYCDGFPSPNPFWDIPSFVTIPADSVPTVGENLKIQIEVVAKKNFFVDSTTLTVKTKGINFLKSTYPVTKAYIAGETYVETHVLNTKIAFAGVYTATFEFFNEFGEEFDCYRLNGIVAPAH